MNLDPDLLAKARDAETRLIDAERDAEVARADFHQAVRRLQLAGGSLREIAEALSISHQRVHQIVEGAGGSRPWRRPRPRDKSVLYCSFCGRGQREVRKLIAGPGVYICDRCVDLADRVIATSEPDATPVSSIEAIAEDAATAKCSFCGKRRDQVTGLAGASEGTICNECVGLCHEIVTEELAELPRSWRSYRTRSFVNVRSPVTSDIMCGRRVSRA
jgi:hypothetical protein